MIVYGTAARGRGAVLVIVRGFTAGVVMSIALDGMGVHVGMAKLGREHLGKTLKGHYRERQCED